MGIVFKERGSMSMCKPINQYLQLLANAEHQSVATSDNGLVVIKKVSEKLLGSKNNHSLIMRQSRHRCVECYRQLSSKCGRAEAQRKAKNVKTFCEKCLMAYCEECFRKTHRP